MELILWRHADAADGYPDMERPLTHKGLEQATHMAEFLRHRMPQNTLILASPAKRAQQTALALTKDFITEPAIAPNCTPQSVLKACNWPTSDHPVLLIGHQPVLGAVIAQLLCMNVSNFSVKKGAIFWLAQRTRNTDDETVLRLAMSPELL